MDSSKNSVLQRTLTRELQLDDRLGDCAFCGAPVLFGQPATEHECDCGEHSAIAH